VSTPLLAAFESVLMSLGRRDGVVPDSGLVERTLLEYRRTHGSIPAVVTVYSKLQSTNCAHVCIYTYPYNPSIALVTRMQAPARRTLVETRRRGERRSIGNRPNAVLRAVGVGSRRAPGKSSSASVASSYDQVISIEPVQRDERWTHFLCVIQCPTFIFRTSFSLTSLTALLNTLTTVQASSLAARTSATLDMLPAQLQLSPFSCANLRLCALSDSTWCRSVQASRARLRSRSVRGRAEVGRRRSGDRESWMDE
jgi:hypothetical protein